MSGRLLDVTAVAAALAAFGAVFLYLSPVPAEDACILFRYARHLAEGHGIVWNVGEDPVEGATEFAWLLVMAGVEFAGLPVFEVSQGIGILISGSTCLLLYAGSRRRMRASVPAAFVATAAFAASTAALHAGAAFGTPLYTILIVAATQRVWSLLHDTTPRRADLLLLPPLLLLAALARPEGVLAGALLLGALAAGRPALIDRRFLASVAALLILPGALYFAWRWSYFGHLLPNTWYVKSGGEGIEAVSVPKIVRFTLYFCGFPLAAILLAAFRRPPSERRRALLLPAAALLYMASYATVAMIQDVGFRFLFPGFALLLAVLPESLDRLAAPGEGLRWRRAAAAGLALATLASSPRMVRASSHRSELDARYELGMALSRFEESGLTMATTEAGYLPFLAGWRAIDPFGLNDEKIAHEGFSEEDLARRAPDLILFHVDTPEYRERWSPPGADRWEAMTKGMYRVAESAGYRLVAVIQAGCDPADGYHWCYLKPEIPEGEAIAEAIREATRSASRRCTDRAR